MKRYHITLGAYTTAGGYVVSAGSLKSINDQLCALEGDMIFCTRCGSHGYIVCNGPRIPETFNGRLLALEGDYAVCKCMPSPTLITAQGVSFQTVEGDASGAMSEHLTGRASHRKSLNNGDGEAQQEQQYGKRILVVNRETGKCLPNQKFIVNVGGSRQEGVTDGAGYADIEAEDGQSIELLVVSHQDN